VQYRNQNAFTILFFLNKENYKKILFFCDLKNDRKLIAAYIAHYKKVWPEIEARIKAAGIETMEIYPKGKRLFMIMEVNETFSFEAKAKSDKQYAKVQEWEVLMWNYQQVAPMANKGEKWLLLEQIYKL